MRYARMKHAFFWLWLGLMLPAQGWAQAPGPAVRLGYLGETGWNPGLKVAWEYALDQPLRWRPQSGGLVVAAEAATFVHRGHYRGYFLGGEGGYRLLLGRWRAGLYGGGGLLRSQLARPAYTVNAGGEVARVRTTGRNSLILSLTGELGWQPARWPLGIHLRPALWVQIPHNHLFLPLLMLDAGVYFPLGVN